MEEQKVWFRNSKGQKLCGLIASQKKRAPAIILVHGLMPRTDKHEYGLYDSLAKKLFSAGFSVFRFDFGGHGESDGDYVDVRVAQEVNDLKYAIDFFLKQNIDKNNLGLISTSFGATPTILLADKRIKAFQLTSPYIILDKHAQYVFSRNCGENWKIELEKTGFMTVKRFTPTDIRRQRIGKLLIEDIKSLNMTREIKKIKKPIFIISGGKDRYVDIKNVRALFKAANKPKKLKIVPFADHNLYGSPKEKKIFLEETIKWFKKNLK
ncbi:MAG TPA: alpha/beta hydrolase [archaeon]|nr:alpha/beta hydrolase [archaeon]